MRELSNEEKQGFIEALKSKWEILNNSYAKLPMTVELQSKKKQYDYFYYFLFINIFFFRKEDMEREMAQLEKDMEAMSKPHVFVFDDI